MGAADDPPADALELPPELDALELKEVPPGASTWTKLGWPQNIHIVSGTPGRPLGAPIRARLSDCDAMRCYLKSANLVARINAIVRSPVDFVDPD